MNLPNKIFFTGVPGSRWSGIAQYLETVNGINTSDHSQEREYVSTQFSGHKGAYFGTGMEFDALLDESYIDSAWANNIGCKIIKSHEWANKLSDIKQQFPSSWIMLVYRPDKISLDWWLKAGGFSISYPNYDVYKNVDVMANEISKQNTAMLDFGYKHNASWDYFTSEWVRNNIGKSQEIPHTFNDILVTIIK